MLPNIFGADFGDKIHCFIFLTDPKHNQFEVCVERTNGLFFFSKVWKALKDFYGIGLGALITLVFAGLGQFAIVVKDRFGKNVRCPVFEPTMKFFIDKTFVQPTFNDVLPPLTAALSYRYNTNNLTIDFVKKLDEDDVHKGFLMLKYEGRVQQVIDMAATTVKLVDDYGNEWDYVLMFGSTPYEHYKIGGSWKRFVDAHNFFEGARIMIGAQVVGKYNSALYVTVIEY